MNKSQLDYMAKIIKEKRKALGYTQEKFSEIIGISYGSYAKIENSFQQPSVDTLIKIAKNLNLSLDKLLLDYNKTDKEDNDNLKYESLLLLIDSLETKDIKNMLFILDRILTIKKSN